MTEAERIVKDAERLSNDWSPIKQKDGFYYGYIAGATAENERLQQLIKEEKEVSKERLKGWIEATKELKSAQELNRELVELVRKKFDGFTVHWSDFESLINKSK